MFTKTKLFKNNSKLKIQGHSDTKKLQKQDLPLSWQDKAIIKLLYGKKKKALDEHN